MRPSQNIITLHCIAFLIIIIIYTAYSIKTTSIVFDFLFDHHYYVVVYYYFVHTTTLISLACVLLLLLLLLLVASTALVALLILHKTRVAAVSCCEI